MNRTRCHVRPDRGDVLRGYGRRSKSRARCSAAAATTADHDVHGRHPVFSGPAQLDHQCRRPCYGEFSPTPDGTWGKADQLRLRRPAARRRGRSLPALPDPPGAVLPTDVATVGAGSAQAARRCMRASQWLCQIAPWRCGWRSASAPISPMIRLFLRGSLPAGAQSVSTSVKVSRGWPSHDWRASV